MTSVLHAIINWFFRPQRRSFIKHIQCFFFHFQTKLLLLTAVGYCKVVREFLRTSQPWYALWQIIGTNYSLYVLGNSLVIARLIKSFKKLQNQELSQWCMLQNQNIIKHTHSFQDTYTFMNNWWQAACATNIKRENSPSQTPIRLFKLMVIAIEVIPTITINYIQIKELFG